jgi:hypothetical protein
VRNLGNEKIINVNVRCVLVNCIPKPAMPQGHSHETTEQNILFLKEGACPRTSIASLGTSPNNTRQKFLGAPTTSPNPENTTSISSGQA